MSKEGLSKNTIIQISQQKREPNWMLQKRLKAFKQFEHKQLPNWVNFTLLNKINFDEINYYLKAADQSSSWDDVPASIKETFEAIGIPQAERGFLAGVSAQFESEVVYHHMQDELTKLGVIFLDMDSAVQQYPDLIKQYFGSVVPANDNKFSALNTAVWSGGSFIYVPKNTKVNLPLQAYFRINAERFGQFERTLIIVDEGSDVHYIEGCTAPMYSSASLHAAVVEIIAKPNSHVRYTTIQNWSKNIYNLVTKRAFVYQDAFVEWVDGNIGSYLTMKYPSVYLLGEGAKGEVLSIALANQEQHQDAGAKFIHLAPHTSSTLTSKSISLGGGRASFRGVVKIGQGYKGCRSRVRCDALIMDGQSRADTYPLIDIKDKTAVIEHEASVNKINDEQVYYLMSRGLSEQEAVNVIVNGFLYEFTKELPLEYAVELNRLIKLEMAGSVG